MKNRIVKCASLFIILAITISIFTFTVGCDFGKKKKLDYNFQLGEMAVDKVENAQYTPDIDKYFEVNAPEVIAQADAMSVLSDSTAEDFTKLIDEYATVRNYAGAGKYLGYDIYEIKDEVRFVVEKVPAFNQWFRMPIMREEEGFASIPYYESWAYYLEYNEETKVLSITRVCWATRSQYLDFENKKSVEDHEDGSSFIQYEIMKTNYLETKDDEIVECFIYSVGIDNVKGGDGYYNKNEKDYYPFEFQYLRNVKDKSMVKYHITVANRYRDDASFDDGGMDIRGLNPYGVRREFTIVNYDGYTDIDVTKIDQKFATLNEPTNNGAVNFDVKSGNIAILLDAIGYKEDVSDLGQKELLDKISKYIIDNFEIKNNWATIYKEQAQAVEVETINGPFYAKNMILEGVGAYASCRNHYKDKIEFSASADIRDISAFDLQKEYSLSMAFKSTKTGEIYIVGTDYQKIESVKYNGSATDYYYRFAGSDIELDTSEVAMAIDTDGTYELVCVLTVKENGQDAILFDPLERAYLMQYYGLNIPDRVDKDGVTHKYKVSGTGKKLEITVTSE